MIRAVCIYCINGALFIYKVGDTGIGLVFGHFAAICLRTCCGMCGLRQPVTTIYDCCNRMVCTNCRKMPQNATTCPKKNFLMLGQLCHKILLNALNIVSLDS